MNNEKLIVAGKPRFESNMASQVYQSWLSFSDSKTIPLKKEVDPLKIPLHLLPNVWLYRYDYFKETYQLKLAGEEILENWPNAHGKPFIEDFMGQVSANVARRHWNFIRQKKAMSYTYQRSNGDFSATERISLPLRGADGRIEYVFGCTIYTRRKSHINSIVPSMSESDTVIFMLTDMD